MTPASSQLSHCQKYQAVICLGDFIVFTFSYSQSDSLWYQSIQPIQLAYTRPNSLAPEATRKHIIMPVIVGIARDKRVHFRLWVSLQMVKRVVPQGQWFRVKIMVQMAVSQVQPLATRSSLRASRLSSSRIFPVAIQLIIMIGITISFAGRPKIKARMI